MVLVAADTFYFYMLAVQEKSFVFVEPCAPYSDHGFNAVKSLAPQDHKRNQAVKIGIFKRPEMGFFDFNALRDFILLPFRQDDTVLDGTIHQGPF